MPPLLQPLLRARAAQGVTLGAGRRQRTSVVEVPSRNELDHVLECPRGAGYEEDAFRYFLDIERARAERSNQPLRVVFATLEPVPGKPAAIPKASATRLFEGLREALRETDVLGWFSQGRIAGAVLAPDDASSDSETLAVIERRVGEGLRRSLPSKVAKTLSVRVVQLLSGRLANE